jgi:hypothetical protein
MFVRPLLRDGDASCFPSAGVPFCAQQRIRDFRWNEPGPTGSEFFRRRAGQTRGASRNVVVTPLAYVTHNRVTLDAIARLGPNARGVAVIRPTVTNAQLKMLA